jgi:hypothetical protein
MRASALYAVRGRVETFRTEAALRRDGDGLPRFVDEEFRGFPGLRAASAVETAAPNDSSHLSCKRQCGTPTLAHITKAHIRHV